MVVFRHPGPLALWWVWVVFALVNIGYLIADGLTIHSVRAIAVLLAVSGVMYACTLHARVEASQDGVTIYNPLRRHRVPWRAVTDVRLGQSVEFACTRPAPRKPATIYSWALYSSGRSRARADMHSNMFGRGQRGISSRAPADAAALAKRHPSQIMADELARRAANAQRADNAVAGVGLPGGAMPGGGMPGDALPGGALPGGAMRGGALPDGPQQAGGLRSSVSWQPVAAILIPAVFVLIAFLVK
jgi:Bacterial PH domain